MDTDIALPDLQFCEPYNNELSLNSADRELLFSRLAEGKIALIYEL
jgi:hypothetical protein